MRAIYILIFSIIFYHCNNGYNSTDKIVIEQKHSIRKEGDTCLNSDTLNSLEKHKYLDLLKANGFEYFNFDLKNSSIVRFKSKCINGYNIVFTLSFFEYQDTLTASKKQEFFKYVNIVNLKLKSWNRIDIRRNDNVLIFILIENKAFINTWEQSIN